MTNVIAEMKNRKGLWLSVASLAFALVFPATFYLITQAEKDGLLGIAGLGGRTAVGLFVTISSLVAVVLGGLSFRNGVRTAGVIGVGLGVVELLLCVLAFRNA